MLKVLVFLVFKASRMGAEAALAVLDADKDSPPSVICIDGNQIVKKPLMECVERVLILFYFKIQ